MTQAYTSLTLPPIERRAPAMPEGATLLTCPWEILLFMGESPYNVAGDRSAVFRWYDDFVRGSRAFGKLLLKLTAPKEHPMFHGFKAYLDADPGVLKPTSFGFVHAEAKFAAHLRPHPALDVNRKHTHTHTHTYTKNKGKN